MSLLLIRWELRPARPSACRLDYINQICGEFSQYIMNCANVTLAERGSRFCGEQSMAEPASGRHARADPRRIAPSTGDDQRADPETRAQRERGALAPGRA